MIKHFYFIENNTGEEFIVGAHTLQGATSVAEDIGYDIATHYGEIPDVEYQYEMSDEEAEASGLDEY